MPKIPLRLKLIGLTAVVGSLAIATLYGAAQTPAQLQEARDQAKAGQEEAASIKLRFDRIREILEPPAVPPVDPPPTGAVGVCGELMDRWHPPVWDTESGPCQTGHEHGEEPPTWIAAAGYQVRYGDIEATPSENILKHQAYKGFLHVQPSGPNAGQEWYYRYHSASNPHDRAARFHSAVVYARDRVIAGGPAPRVSVFRMWIDTGDRVADRFPPRNVDGFPGQNVRPVIFAPDATSISQNLGCETWYIGDFKSDRTEAAGWRPETGLTICGTTTVYVPGEHLTAHNYDTWVLTGNLGLTRRLEITWFGPDSPDKRAELDLVPRDSVFYADQFGALMSGQSDPRCGQPVIYGDQTFSRLCLPNYLSSNLRTIGFNDGNSSQKDFPGEGLGVKTPN